MAILPEILFSERTRCDSGDRQNPTEAKDAGDPCLEKRDAPTRATFYITQEGIKQTLVDGRATGV